MGLAAGALHFDSPSQDREAERREFETVRDHLFVRPSNMRRLFCYVCEKYLAGDIREIKEYSIAVEALGRPEGFDPGTDSIVRVEAHRLRSRLNWYYTHKAQHSAVRISLPHGGYVPYFQHIGNTPPIASQASDPIPGHQATPDDLTRWPTASDAGVPANYSETAYLSPMHVVTLLAIVLLIGLGCLLFFRGRGSQRFASAAAPFVPPAGPPLVATGKFPAIRILAGRNFPGTLDWDGELWVADRDYTGGEAAESTQNAFEFTNTPALYTHRRRGIFQYAIPVPPGSYELKLHFADAYFGAGNPDQGGEASRLFTVLADGKPLLSDFDVIADAGGPNTADIKVFTGLHPSPDGRLHLNFLADRNVPFVNAIEVLPDPSPKMLPVRIYTGLTPYTDQTGAIWSSDRYFRGGVHVHSPTNQVPIGDADARFGNFVYQIPVVANGLYTVRLRFCPVPLPSPQGSAAPPNIFSISVNGRLLLEDFQLPGGHPARRCETREFQSLRSTAQGKLAFSFLPRSGYAFLTSIAVDQQ